MRGIYSVILKKYSCLHCEVEPDPSHMVLISVSLALSQTPAYTVRP